MAAKKKTVVKAVAKTSVKLDPAKEAQKLIKRAVYLEKHIARLTKLAAKCRAQAAKLAAKTLAKPKCRYSPKLQAALAEIAKLGQEADIGHAMNVVESPEGTAEALQVVAEVLKGEFK